MKKVITLLLVLFLSCSGRKILNVGILIGVDENIDVAKSFIKKMEEYGYVQDENIIYDIQDGKSDFGIMREICNNFVEKKVDLILTITHGATQAAKDATAESGIPVVFSYAVTNKGDLINSIAEPGGNITGVRYPIPDMAIKRFEFLLEINPEIKNVLLPYKKDYPPALIVVNGLKEISEEKGVSLIEATYSTLDEMEDFFNKVEEGNFVYDSILTLPEPFVYSDRGWEIVKDFSYKHNVPIAANSFHMSRGGALFSYTNIDEEMGELAAPLVDKIFKGAEVGKIPVVTPKTYLHINLVRANELGVKIPDNMIKLATEVINEGE